MGALEALRASLPEAAKDIKLNLEAVLRPGSLSPAQRWGVAVGAAAAARSPRLLRALVEAATEVGPEVIEDAQAAAALMAMNNVFYRFRHLIGTESYAQRPARLRMNRLVKSATSKVDFELFCLAISAINGCEACLVAHERVVIEGGISEEQVHDAIRIAATVNAAATALDLVEAAEAAPAP